MTVLLAFLFCGVARSPRAGIICLTLCNIPLPLNVKGYILHFQVFQRIIKDLRGSYVMKLWQRLGSILVGAIAIRHQIGYVKFSWQNKPILDKLKSVTPNRCGFLQLAVYWSSVWGVNKKPLVSKHGKTTRGFSLRHYKEKDYLTSNTTL